MLCLPACLLLAACRVDDSDARSPLSEVGTAATTDETRPTVADSMPLSERQALPGRIAFISERDGNKEVYSVRPDGTAEQRITERPADDFFGTVLPDGAGLLLIALEGDDGDRVERFWLHPAAGGAPRAVGPRGALMRNPAWGPDGRWVIFESNTRDGYRDIYRLENATGEVRALTNNPEGNFRPSLSPDGQWVVFSSSRDSVSELYRMRPDGSEVRRLTFTPRDEWGVRWSSDGGLLAFLSDRDGSDRIYLGDPNGQGIRRLSTEPFNPYVIEDKPTWAPNRARIAWVHREPEKPSRIRFVDLSTGERGEIRAPAPGDMDDPAWSPDGEQLAFSLTDGDQAQVYVARGDGSAPTPVTRGAGPNWAPVWLAGH